jgi:hypothetical protein
MVDDRELVQALNLLQSSPSFVLRQCDDRRMDVSQVALVPNDGSVYWIAGESQLPVGRAIPSVFIVENGGGNLIAVYWFIDKAWCKPSDPDTLAKLDLRREDVFPFDWSYAVPVENDIYHAEP